MKAGNRRVRSDGVSLPIWSAMMLAVAAYATDPPHSTSNGCSDCHILHRAPGAQLTDVNGNDNLCMSCHTTGGTAFNKPFTSGNQALPWPGLPSGINATGTSHRWDASAAGHVVFLGGAGTPSTGRLVPVGAYTGVYAKTYTLTISTAGAVGAARFNWSATTPGGGSGASVLTAVATPLDQGVAVTFLNGTGTSFQVNDQWQIYVRPDLRNPTNTLMQLHSSSNVAYCSTCHDQHSQALAPFDAAAPAYGGAGTGAGRHFLRVANNSNQQCLDCHAARNVTNSVAGSHPVEISFSADVTHKAAALLPLEPGTNTFSCLTCHKMHYAAVNDGSLLRTNSLLLCVDCHTLANTNVTTAHFDTADSNTLWPGGKWGSLMPARTNTAYRGTCVNCHAVHGWPDASNPTNHYAKLLADSEENFCYTCHGTNGPAVKLVRTDFTDAYRHPVSNTDPLRFLGRTVECVDCHNVHQAKDGARSYTNVATAARNAITNSPSLIGAPGVAFSYASLSNFQPVALSAYTAIPKTTGASNEYQVCFRCHSGYGFPSYSTGTATFTTNSTTLTGAGTAWTSNMVGATVIRTGDTNMYRVTAVASGTSLTMTPAFRYATVAGQSYTLSIPPPGLTPIATNGFRGTATFTTNSATVAGAGTSWTNGLVGMWIMRNGDTGSVYKITAVANTTSLTIFPAYTGATVAAQSFVISVATDVAQEFSPRNKSGHPVVAGLNSYSNSTAPRALAAGALKTPWNVNMGTQTMTCSDCHNTDSTATGAAQGPHGSAVRFMLRNFGNTATNWPTGTSFANSWCVNCHTDNVSLNGSHGTHYGNPGCYACHIVVPHGGKMSRLIGDKDGNMPLRYAFNGNISNNYVYSFTKSSGTYSSGNCRANCNSHTRSSSTTMENWW
jgi:predicted CXXCH cytochrome family protein